MCFLHQLTWLVSYQSNVTCALSTKMMNGKQCTVAWNMDNIKISHYEENVTESIIKILDDEYGKEPPLVVIQGLMHEYLGMTIDFSEPGKVKFYMKDYNKNLLEECPKDLRKVLQTHLLSIISSRSALLQTQSSKLWQNYIITSQPN